MAEKNRKERIRKNHLIRRDREISPEGSVKTTEAFDRKSGDQFLAAIKTRGETGSIYLTTQGDMAPVDHEVYFNRGRAFKAVDKANDVGIPAQLFAVHNFEDQPKSFSIERKNTCWRVYPVKMTEGGAPRFIQEPVSLFKKMGVVFDHYAIAVSGKTSTPSSIHPDKKSNRIARALSRSIGLALSNSLSRLKANKHPIYTTLLLGCYGRRSCYLVEIARWEPRHRKHPVPKTNAEGVGHASPY